MMFIVIRVSPILPDVTARGESIYVCHCKGITERQVTAAVDDGCTRIAELRAELGVASNCGKCACHVRDVLNEALAASAVVPQVGYFQPQPVAV